MKSDNYFTRVKIVIIAVFILIVFTNIGGFLFNKVVSDGARSGTVQKVTTKGLIFSTMELELAMDGIKSSLDSEVSNTFQASITDPAIMEQLSGLMGKRVVVNYQQFLLVNPMEGETSYRITKVTEITE